MELSIIPLDQNLIQRANSNSFGGTRGDTSDAAYQAYGREILGWSIADSRKEKLLQELHRRYSAILKYEAQHVSVMYAGPANYNAKKLDKSDQVFRTTAEFTEWFNGVREQVKSATREDDKVQRILETIEFCDQRPELNPMGELAELAMLDNAKFIELFEKLQPKYRWRKNSNIYKLYLASKDGKVQEIKKEVVFQDDNFTAYKEGDRYYIKFVLRCKRQLHVALKSRGWWWNAYQEAYSTYPSKFDLEWVKGISENYEKYI